MSEIPDKYSEENAPFLGVPFTAKEAFGITGRVIFMFNVYLQSLAFFCANVNENKICTSDFHVIASYYYFLILGLPNTSGLLKRKGITAEKDADAVALMKEAGAIPIGLTNCSELCMWLESSNLVYGRCNNAYHQGRIVGGSSGKFSLVVWT